MDGQSRTYATRVVVVGVAPVDLGRLVPAGTAVPVRLAADPGREELTALTGLLGDGASAGDDALAVVPRAHAEPAVQRLRTAASALGGRPLPVHLSDLPPVGVAALAALAAVLGQHAPAGVLGGALDRLEAELVVVAAARSAAGADVPLGTRLRASLPGRALVSRRHPEPRAEVVRRADVVEALAALVPAGFALAAVEGRSPLAAAAALADAAGAVALEAPEDVRPSTRRTGRVEAVALPADLAGVTQRVLGLPAAPCPWCGEPAAATPCPQCGHLRNPALEGAAA